MHTCGKDSYTLREAALSITFWDPRSQARGINPRIGTDYAVEVLAVGLKIGYANVVYDSDSTHAIDRLAEECQR
jgi:hypothetical protein